MAAVSPSTRDLSKYSRLFHDVSKRVGGIRRRDERDGSPRMREVFWWGYFSDRVMMRGHHLKGYQRVPRKTFTVQRSDIHES